MKRNRIIHLLAVALVSFSLVFLSSCGSDEENFISAPSVDSSSSDDSGSQQSDVEILFKILSPQSSSTQGTTFVVSGYALGSDGSPADDVIIECGSKSILLHPSGTNWSSSLSISTDETVEVVLKGKAVKGSRASDYESVRFFVSPSVPNLVVDHLPGITNVSSIKVSGSASIEAGEIEDVYFRLNGGDWQATSGSFELSNKVKNWFVNIDLSEGENHLDFKVKTKDGKEVESSVNISLDTNPPSFVSVSPENGAVLSETAELSAVVNESSHLTISVNGDEVNQASGTNISAQINTYLYSGTITVVFSAVDLAGNSSALTNLYVVSNSSGGENNGGDSGGSGNGGSFPGDGSYDFRDETVYFVMLDRFADGDPNNNNIYGDEYRTPNNDSDEALRYYNGGDFKGLIENLDYIKSMGFTAIWITPVVKQPPGRYVNSGGTYDAAGYHGYWGFDFDSIDPHLESPGYTFDDLIREAHNRGIKIVLDIVVNHGHGGDVAESVQWYDYRTKVKMNGTWWDYLDDPYYNPADPHTGFFNHAGDYKLLDLLDFNELQPETKEALKAVYKKFIDRGVDAFRIDTVAYMRKEWWGEFTDAMWEYASSKGKPWFWQAGEAWVATRSDALSYTTYSTHGAMSILDLHGSCMDFPGQAKNVFAGSDGFERMNDIMASDYDGKIDPTFLGTFVDNHDKPRFPGGWRENGELVRIWKNALNWYFLARGIPIVYYGTELDGTWDSLNDYGAGEPKNRKFMGQSRINNVLNNPDNYPLYRHLQLLNYIRHTEPAIRKGTQYNIQMSGDIAVFKREYITSVAYVVLNKGGSASSVTLNSIADGNYRVLVPAGGNALTTNFVSVSGGSYTVNIGANSFVVMVYQYPDPANSVSVIGDYSASMTRKIGNLWEGTISVPQTGTVNIKFSVDYDGTVKVFGDDDEIGAFLPLKNTAEEVDDYISFDAPASGDYKITFNDATKHYEVSYEGELPITTLVIHSYVSDPDWVGVCGSYSPPTSYDDQSNHAGDLPWWGDEPAVRCTNVGVDENGRNVWVWKTTSIESGKKFEWKPRKNGEDWSQGGNFVGYGGQTTEITYDW